MRAIGRRRERDIERDGEKKREVKREKKRGVCERGQMRGKRVDV